MPTATSSASTRITITIGRKDSAVTNYTTRHKIINTILLILQHLLTDNIASMFTTTTTILCLLGSYAFL